MLFYMKTITLKSHIFCMTPAKPFQNNKKYPKSFSGHLLYCKNDLLLRYISSFFSSNPFILTFFIASLLLVASSFLSILVT